MGVLEKQLKGVTLGRKRALPTLRHRNGRTAPTSRQGTPLKPAAAGRGGGHISPDPQRSGAVPPPRRLARWVLLPSSPGFQVAAWDRASISTVDSLFIKLWDNSLPRGMLSCLAVWD